MSRLKVITMKTDAIKQLYVMKTQNFILKVINLQYFKKADNKTRCVKCYESYKDKIFNDFEKQYKEDQDHWHSDIDYSL